MHVARFRQQFARADAEYLGQHATAGDAPLERVRNRLRLLVDFLEHVMAVFAALDCIGAEMRQLDRTLHGAAVLVVYSYAIARGVGDVAFGKIDEAPCHRQQRMDVRGDELFTVGEAGDHRAAATRADHAAGLALADHRDRIRPAQARQGFLYRREQVRAVGLITLDQMGDDLGIGFARELVAERLEFGAQFLVVLDDAVVHDGNISARSDGMRIERVRRAMRGPACVRDTGEPRDRLRGMQQFELVHLAFRAHALEARIGQQGDTRGIVAAVLQRFQAGDQRADHIAPRGGADDSTHGHALVRDAYFSRSAAATRATSGLFAGASSRGSSLASRARRSAHRPVRPG